ncbi:TPA: hypothetical protein U7D87_001015 [Streptococcus agalactiae]|uniref:hypothetical protein n=1 Tax=Streptococcus agalactiae TaxID=1311 RepID=UPI0002BC694B|nr:hypothetical protein [Streptococcus agalactiae]QBX19161.1 hypothetical protein Javan47_0048 [Streptococcus phage Javan47]HEO8207785.1 hypothetical protein [Streptococcus agalactiae ADL-350]AIX04374.1 putative phage protein [Streptococcus agalactiae CNCTC 10/84]EPT56750.1 membrane protein [Streptococcus agalactiae CCUG 25532]EPT85613.1 membrane protein [Streptococcus agalactiae BSU247]
MIDFVQVGAFAGAALSILGVWGFIVNPFKKAMEANEIAMAQLKDSLKELAYELKNIDRDREITKAVIDRHEERLGRVEDDIIINKEQIKTLFNKEK